MNYTAPPPPPPPPVPTTARTGLAITSLVLGIFAFLLSFFVIGSLFAIIALVLGLVHIGGKRGPAGMAWWGIGLSLVAVVISIGMGVVYFKAVREIKKTFASMKSELGLTEAHDWEGVLAPDFSVTTPDGKVVQLSELKGKRIALNFWSTWWQPSVNQLPQLIKLRTETPGDDLVIIGISTEDPETLGAFAKKKGINYLVASGTNLPAPFKDIQKLPTTFFIDRKGIIQSVSSGTQNFEDLKAKASAADFSGEPKAAPGPPSSPLADSDHKLIPSQAWTKPLAGGQDVCIGDWDEDGQPDILVLGNAKLHVFDLDGTEKKTIALPGQFASIEYGRNKDKGPRLAAYTSWQRKVVVLDRNGKEVWNYSATMGVDGAHWGDLDGDGTDELVVGMNGFGGLHAVSADGKLLWKVTMGNVWGQAIIPAAADRGALVLATEAGGSVRVFDAKGKQLRSFRPDGKYCTQIAASCMDTNPSSSTLQGLAEAQGQAVAFDTSGAVRWSSPCTTGGGGPTGRAFACGDIDGDGIKEWAFPDASGNVLLATASGEALATVKNVTGAHLAIVPTREGRGLLVMVLNGNLTAYSFKPEQP